MGTPASVSQWIDLLKLGDAGAAEKLWNRFSVRLVELARRKLAAKPRGMADEDDIAQSVFYSICRGAAAGRFRGVANRDDLWWILVGVTRQKVVDHVRRETAVKRGAGRVYQESSLTDSRALHQVTGDAPTPEFVAMLREQHERLLGLLRTDQLRQVAAHRIDGFEVSEIASDLQLSTRSVERKLALIREVWSGELETSPLTL